MEWKLFEEDKLLFLEGAFIAINQSDMESARWLIEAAEAFDKENPLCLIARGYMALHKLDTAEATKWFNKCLEHHPKNELARTMLGLAYIVGEKKMGEGEKLCAEIVKETKDAEMKKFASSALEFADKEMKGGYKGSPLDLASKPHKKPKHR